MNFVIVASSFSVVSSARNPDLEIEYEQLLPLSQFNATPVISWFNATPAISHPELEYLLIFTPSLHSYNTAPCLPHGPIVQSVAFNQNAEQECRMQSRNRFPGLCRFHTVANHCEEKKISCESRMQHAPLLIVCFASPPLDRIHRFLMTTQFERHKKQVCPLLFMITGRSLSSSPTSSHSCFKISGSNKK